MSDLPLLSPEQHQTQWAAISFGERRQITKRINKGLVAESRTEAKLAIPIARRQLKFWKFAWLLGPAGALVQLNKGAAVFVVNMLFSTLVLGGISLFFFRRVQAAERLSSELLRAGGSSRSSKRPKRTPASDSSVEERAPKPTRKGPDPTARLADWSDDGPSKHTSKAKRRRRK